MRFHIPIALHPIDAPVQSVPEAVAAMASCEAWTHLAFVSNAKWSLLQPCLGAWPPVAEVWPMARRRFCEAVAFRVWDDFERLAAYPELGLAPARALRGFVLHHLSQGPDEPASWSMSAPDVEGLSAPAAAEAREAFDRLRDRWSLDAFDSPLFGSLRLVAETPERQWRLRLDSFDDLMTSLAVNAEHAAQCRARRLAQQTMSETVGFGRARPRF